MENLENPVVPAVNRALNILEFVAKAREPVSIKQVAQSLELPNTTAFRIVKQLSIRGYLEESEAWLLSSGASASDIIQRNDLYQ